MIQACHVVPEEKKVERNKKYIGKWRAWQVQSVVVKCDCRRVCPPGSSIKLLAGKSCCSLPSIVCNNDLVQNI